MTIGLTPFRRGAPVEEDGPGLGITTLRGRPIMVIYEATYIALSTSRSYSIRHF
jgi:hypothetical protein